MLIEQLTELAKKIAPDRNTFRKLQKASAVLMEGVMDLGVTGKHYGEGSTAEDRLTRAWQKLCSLAGEADVPLEGLSAKEFVEDLRRELGTIRRTKEPICSELRQALFSYFFIGAVKLRTRAYRRGGDRKVDSS